MKKIMQFRFVENEHSLNSPLTLTRDDLTSGSLLYKYGPVSQLGIQAPTGFKFYLNDGVSPIRIGETGIYELDLEGIGRIYKLKITSDELEKLSAGNYLVIDIVYEGGG